MGLFSNIAGRTKDDEPWLANLMDDETVPLAELEVATNPFVAPPADQAGSEWGMPDLHEPVELGASVPIEVVPPALAGLLDDGAASQTFAFDSGFAGSFEAAPFANAAPSSFDDQMLDLDPIPHDTVSLRDFSVAPDAVEPQSLEPATQAWAEPPATELVDTTQTPSWGQGFGDHLAALPDTFDRRDPVDQPAVNQVGAPLADRHHGPTGEHAPAQLAAFGLEPGASWSELREHYLELLSTTEYHDMTEPAEAAELDGFRRQINTGYASLRLLAAH